MEECEREVARTRRAVERGAPAVALCRAVARRLNLPAEEFMLLVANYGGERCEGEAELLEAVYEGARELLPRTQVLALEGAEEGEGKEGGKCSWSYHFHEVRSERREERERLESELRSYGGGRMEDGVRGRATGNPEDGLRGRSTLAELRRLVRREKEREMVPLIVDALAALCQRHGLRMGALRRQILRAAVLAVTRCWSWLGPEILLAGVTALREEE